MANLSQNTLLLEGLDGSNPLAFLAALGTLRCLTLAWPDRNVQMAWTQHAGAWRPRLHVLPMVTREQLIDDLPNTLTPLDDMVPPDLRHAAETAGPTNKKGQPKWRGKLRFPVNDYLNFLKKVTQAQTKHWARQREFACVWASPPLKETADNIEVVVRTPFDFTAGNQSFVEMISKLIYTCSSEDLRKCLFEPWEYQPGGISFRWDPIDDARRYALQAVDPADSNRNPAPSVPAANRLALEALPLFPSFAQGAKLHTTGFSHFDRETVWTWPIWAVNLRLDSIRSLVASRLLHVPNPNYSELHARGVVEVYRVTMVMPSGRYRNFTQAQSVFFGQ